MSSCNPTATIPVPGSINMGIRRASACAWKNVGVVLDEKNLELTITLTDPESYTEPWTSGPASLERLPTEDYPVAELRQDICAPIDENYFNEIIRNPAGGVTD